MAVWTFFIVSPFTLYVRTFRWRRQTSSAHAHTHTYCDQPNRYSFIKGVHGQFISGVENCSCHLSLMVSRSFQSTGFPWTRAASRWSRTLEMWDVPPAVQQLLFSTASETAGSVLTGLELLISCLSMWISVCQREWTFIVADVIKAKHTFVILIRLPVTILCFVCLLVV